MSGFSRAGVTTLCAFAAVAFVMSGTIFSAAAFDGAPISVSFSFIPAKGAYYPCEEFSIEVTVVNTIPLGDYLYDDLAYKEKVVNISAHFSWMAPNEYVWNNVSETSSWLAADGGTETYQLDASVPGTATEQTYSYTIVVEYLAHTAWGNITYYWGVGVTYRDFDVTTDTETVLSLSFDFSPVQSYYSPGDGFSLVVTATSVLPEGVDSSDVFPCKVQNISVHFSWMPDGETAWANVSGQSQWLHPLANSTESYSVPLAVPSNASDGTYSYTVKVEYCEDALWAELESGWGGGTVYRDFSVWGEEQAATGAVDYVPFMAGVLVVLAIGGLGAALYYRDQGARRGALMRSTRTPTVFNGANGQAYPVIRPMPGEHFPVDKGFVYLVKEKRPVFTFQMFNEAVEKGARGMLVAREHPTRLKEQYGFSADKVLWLTRRTGKDHIDPTELSLLSLRISRYIEEGQRTVVTLEGLEYLITQNDFETVFRFVNHMLDFVLAHDSAVIMAVDPRTLSTRELALLERSARVVEPIEPPSESPPQPPAEDKAQQPA